MRKLTLTVLCLGLACGSESAVTSSQVAVDLFIEGGGLRITRVYPAREFPIAHFDSPRRLRYELRDDAGQLIVSGHVPDFRIAHTESLPDGTMERADLELGFGGGSLRLPTVPGTLILFEPRGGEVARTSFDPFRIQQPLAGPDDILTGPELVIGGLSADAAVDLLFLGDGYTEAEMDQFHIDVESAMNSFLALPHYAAYASRFNAWRQDVRSTETGTDDPDAGIDLDTAFDVGMGEGDLRRCVFFKTGEGADLARQLGVAAGADVVVMIANTTEYGGCAQSGLFAVTRDPGVAAVIAHELGHSLLQLADEYPYGTCNPNASAANVTSETDAATIPWGDLLTPGIDLPTAAGTAGVGAFEGASYCATGMYRPQDNCLMRETGAPFCAVCARERDRYFNVFGNPTGPQLDCPPEWSRDGICDLCLGDGVDPACPAEGCDADGMCDTADNEDCGSCPVDCGECGGAGGCGDGVCDGDETDATCGQDCGCASLGQCDWFAATGCWCDPDCAAEGDCCADIDVCGF
jgi:hypothetical protein